MQCLTLHPRVEGNAVEPSRLRLPPGKSLSGLALEELVRYMRFFKA